MASLAELLAGIDMGGDPPAQNDFATPLRSLANDLPLSPYRQYASMPDDTMTRAGVPLGVLRDLVINSETANTAAYSGKSPYDVLAIGPGDQGNARDLPVNQHGFPDRPPVKSAWGYPSTGAGAFQFERDTYGDIAKRIGLRDFSQPSQDAAFNYVVTTPYGGKSGVFPWEKNVNLVSALARARK